jgi:hypothetical protein
MNEPMKKPATGTWRIKPLMSFATALQNITAGSPRRPSDYWGRLSRRSGNPGPARVQGYPDMMPSQDVGLHGSEAVAFAVDLSHDSQALIRARPAQVTAAGGHQRLCFQRYVFNRRRFCRAANEHDAIPECGNDV